MEVLVVEDNENSRMFQESVLEARGYLVRSAGNGKEALRMLKRFPPDLIISDILMPEMDGYAFCRAVKSDDRLKHIPFVFYSATYTDPRDVQFAMDLGASLFLVKPAVVPTFMDAIEKVLRTPVKKGPPSRDKPLKTARDLEHSHAGILMRKLDKKIKELEKERLELKKTKESLQKAQQIARIGNWDWDVAEKQLRCSDEIHRIFGLDPETANAGRGAFLELVHPDDRPSVRANMDMALLGHEPFEMEYRIVTPDGKQKTLFEQTEVDFDGKTGEATRVVGIVRDVTERKRILEEKQALEKRLNIARKMEALGALASGVAHDFNNILTPILGYAELAHANLPEKNRNRIYQEKIVSAAIRAKELINQILTFSRGADQERRPVRIHTIVKEVLKFLRPSFPPSIEIRENIDPDCGAVVADPTQIHQVVMNLVSNARRAMRETGGVLTVTLSRLEPEKDDFPADPELKKGPYVSLQVSDTGCGIEKNELDRVFEPYYTTREKRGGTGLGLAVVHGIVKNHGGHISVRSEPRKGAVFHVYLPILKTAPAFAESKNPEPAPTGNEHIMLVDDEIEVLEIGKEMAEHLGYRVSVFSCPERALEAFEKNGSRYDGIVTDLIMPETSGIELARGILSLRPDTPVLLCSGFGETIDGRKARELGIREVIMKPLVLRNFAEALRRVLDGRQ